MDLVDIKGVYAVYTSEPRNGKREVIKHTKKDHTSYITGEHECSCYASEVNSRRCKHIMMINDLYSGSGVNPLDAQDFLISLGERIQQDIPEFDISQLTALENMPQSLELIEIELPLPPDSKYYVVYKRGESTLVVMIKCWKQKS